MAVSPLPNQAILTWDAVEQACWYDIYLNGEFIRTVNSSVLTERLGSNEYPLPSATSFVCAVAARDNNDVLGYAIQMFKTKSWSGRYQWINLTNRDNGGRCRNLLLEVDDSTSSFVITGIFDRRCQLFPMVEEQRVGLSLSYHGGSEEEVSYRTNATVFNTTGITPKSWKVLRSECGISHCTTTIQTRVGLISATTVSTYSFFIDEAGKRRIRFETKGEGLADKGMFKSPNPGEEGAYIFTEIGL